MEFVKSPSFSVFYEGRNISADLRSSLLSLTYSDKVAGESDEIQLTVEDSAGLWRNAWLPTKGDRLDVSIGFVEYLFPCGVFEIDEIEISGPPDVVNIRGLAAGITQAVRTRRSYSHERKSLSQIAGTIAKEHGLTVSGTIDRDVLIDRRSQNRETDLGFLHRLSKEFGYVFSVRGTQLVFSSIYELESASSVAELHRSDLIRYNLKDTSSAVYKSAKVKYHDPNSQELVEASVDDETGFETTGDVLTIFDKAENRQQAEQKARAALHLSNTRSQEGTISIPGNPLILAGVNFDLTGLGRLSGVYHVKSSTHSMTPSGGYTTEAEIKKVSTIDESRWT